MPSNRGKSILAIWTCTASLVHSGCMAPWGAPATPVETAPPATVTSQNPVHDTNAAAPNADPAVDPGMAAVFDKLQQIREIDPAAEQKLIETLRQTPAKSWPLVAEQFRASLAYHQQLLAERDDSNRTAESLQAYSQVAVPSVDLITAHSSESSKAETTPLPQSMQLSAQDPINDPPIPTYPTRVNSKDMPSPTNNGSQATSKNASDKQHAPILPAAFESSVGYTGADDNAEPVEPPPPHEDWQTLVDRAADDLSRRVAESPSTTGEVHQHVSLRILRLLAGNTEGALEPIPNIQSRDQDYWSRQLFALATYLDHHGQPDDQRRAAASVVHLDEAVSHLREIGSLSVRNLSFCKNVNGYGAIEPYESDRFSPGEEVSLYVEVENYHSQSTEKGFCTLLGSTYELLDDQGERVDGGEFPDVDDCCRSRRRDFHIRYGLTLPAGLAPGSYRLQLVVKDRQSDKIGTASIAFEIRGSSS